MIPDEPLLDAENNWEILKEFEDFEINGFGGGAAKAI